MKDTKSSGDMLKETNNINRSLFTLGKVMRRPAAVDTESSSPSIDTLADVDSEEERNP